MLTRRAFVKGLLATLCAGALRGRLFQPEGSPPVQPPSIVAGEPAPEERAIVVKEIGVAIGRGSLMELDNLGWHVDSETMGTLCAYWGHRCLTCPAWRPNGAVQGGHDCGLCPRLGFVTGAEDG